MQASKIIPRQVYAIKQGEALVRFRVKSVITTQTRTEAKSSPHDYASVVIGNVAEAGHPNDQVRLSPEAILGPYQEYTELQARQQAEEDARKTAQAESEALCQELCQTFYKLSRLTPETSERYHRRIFDLAYPDGVQISSAGVKPLLAVLRGLAQLRVVA